MNEINHLTIALAISGNLTAIIPNAYIDFFDNSESTSVTYLWLNYIYSPSSFNISPRLLSEAIRANISSFKNLL